MTSENSNYRKDIVDSILPYARKDERLVLLVCDMGFGVTNRFQEEFPKRVYNMGMMEQGTVGIAAGMAMTGLVPIVYSIVNFIVYRALEQVRNDVMLQDLNVKFIATGVNDYFKFLGPSHTCGQDDIRLMEMVRMPVYDPYRLPAGGSCEAMIDEWITSPRAGYFRV